MGRESLGVDHEQVETCPIAHCKCILQNKELAEGAAAEEAKVEETKVEVTMAEEKKETNVAEDLERQEHQVTSRVREGESKGSMTVRAARVKQKAVQAAQAAVAAEAALQAAVTELASSVVAATAVAATAAEA